MKSEKLIILIVDESILFINRMIRILQDLNNVQIILQASSYSEAIELIEEIQPDLILMDIFLKDNEKTGITLLKEIRANYSSIEVAVITNYADDFYRDNCKHLGAHHFFDKSNEFDLIPKMIQDKVLP
ncbi:MAG: response regulator transcription factor [Chitinophagales bacterium]